MHRRFAVAAAISLLFGIVCIAADFDPNTPWFFLGLLAVILAGQATIGAYFSGKRQTIDDAFEAGYQAGFHKGERVRPKVIRLERDRERASHRSQGQG